LQRGAGPNAEADPFDPCDPSDRCFNRSKPMSRGGIEKQLPGFAKNDDEEWKGVARNDERWKGFDENDEGKWSFRSGVVSAVRAVADCRNTGGGTDEQALGVAAIL
jgi:hypothetical protein